MITDFQFSAGIKNDMSTNDVGMCGCQGNSWVGVRHGQQSHTSVTWVKLHAKFKRNTMHKRHQLENSESKRRL